MSAVPAIPIQQDLRNAAQQLSSVAGDNAALEARLLAQHAWGYTPERLLRDAHLPIGGIGRGQLATLVERRLQHEPISHILGFKDFWKDRFLVTSDVLTPRADSETLIEALLRLRSDTSAPLRMLELGVGSGALLLSSLREYPHATGHAVDVSPAALAVAKQNAERLGLASRVAFCEGDWCNPLDKTDGFDIIITNPPYIARADIAALDEDVKGYEPHLALDGGVDGLDCYRSIFSTITPHMNEGALMLVEVGQCQSTDVATLGRNAGLHHTETCNDLAGIARIVCFTR